MSAAGTVPIKGEAKRRVGWAAVTWMGMALVVVATLGVFVIWHLVRRGRLIRDGQPPPRHIELPELGPSEPQPGSGVAEPPKR